jgi:hypothetical protein
VLQLGYCGAGAVAGLSVFAGPAVEAGGGAGAPSTSSTSSEPLVTAGAAAVGGGTSVAGASAGAPTAPALLAETFIRISWAPSELIGTSIIGGRQPSALAANPSAFRQPSALATGAAAGAAAADAAAAPLPRAGNWPSPAGSALSLHGMTHLTYALVAPTCAAAAAAATTTAPAPDAVWGVAFTVLPLAPQSTGARLALLARAAERVRADWRGALDPSVWTPATDGALVELARSVVGAVNAARRGGGGGGGRRGRDRAAGASVFDDAAAAAAAAGDAAS